MLFRSGYIKSINAEEVGKIALALGAGRETMESVLDLSVGIVLNQKVDDKVEKDEILAYIHSNDIEKAKIAEKNLLQVFEIGSKNLTRKQLIYKEVN